jgi:glycosyltransferase involved in cell wall biosynthesis
MDIHIYVLCYNESVLLPHMVAHYRKLLPSCKITVFDNYSTDNSREIALSLGCEVVLVDSGGIMDDRLHALIKNSAWKSLERGWVIMIDMDEFLCVTEDDLRFEDEQGTVVLRTRIADMVGESQTLDITDIDIHAIRKHVPGLTDGKRICFRREKVGEMHYTMGAENCNPHGTGGSHERPVPVSSRRYILKHFSHIGLPFLINKMIKRYERTELMRQLGCAIHYTNNIEAIQNEYADRLGRATLLDI